MNEEYTGELTFQKVFELIKKSFVRMLIYALILAVLGGGITAIATIATKDSGEYKAIIEYSYTGVENGKDPYDNMLDTSRIKSTIVVNNALKNMGITESEVVLNYSQILIDNLAVDGYIPASMAKDLEKNASLTYFPTRYTITLTESARLPFRDSQYIQFLNELINSYKEYFKDAYNYGKVLSPSVADDPLGTASDYFDLCISYKVAIEELLAQLSTLKTNVSDRYNKLYTNINVLNNELSSIEYYILTNNITKEGTSADLTTTLNTRKAEFQRRSERYKELADKLYEEVIKTYENQTSKVITSDGVVTVTTSESKYYDTLIKQYNDYRSNQTNFSYQAQVIEDQIALIGAGIPTEAQRTAVENRFRTFDAALHNTLDTINAELGQYSVKNVTENGVKTAMNAVKTQMINYMLIIIVAVVCAFVGCLAAIAATVIINKKRAKKAEAIVQ